MATTSLRHIAISEENYQLLKNLGKAGDSFNDVIKQLLEKNSAKLITLPDSFKDYWELENYFNKIGSVIMNHKTGPGSDSVALIVNSSNVFYKLKNDRFVPCIAEERYA